MSNFNLIFGVTGIIVCKIRKKKKKKTLFGVLKVVIFDLCWIKQCKYVSIKKFVFASAICIKQSHFVIRKRTCLYIMHMPKQKQTPHNLYISIIYNDMCVCAKKSYKSAGYCLYLFTFKKKSLTFQINWYNLHILK